MKQIYLDQPEKKIILRFFILHIIFTRIYINTCTKYLSGSVLCPGPKSSSISSWRDFSVSRSNCTSLVNIFSSTSEPGLFNEEEKKCHKMSTHLFGVNIRQSMSTEETSEMFN